MKSKGRYAISMKILWNFDTQKQFIFSWLNFERPLKINTEKMGMNLNFFSNRPSTDRSLSHD